MDKLQDTIRPIHYLGSKLRMLDTIKEAIDRVDESDGMICDLFSGSGTVSEYLMKYYDVVAVDIQKYSQILCEANMSSIDMDTSAILNDIQKRIEGSSLNKAFEDLIEYEHKALANAEDGIISPLYEIIEDGSLYIYQHNETGKVSPDFEIVLYNTEQSLKKYNLQDSVDTMITRYFGGLYFSYEQSIIMDCIEKYVFEHDGILKTKLLAALLSTASDLVNTVGKQFAQPLKVRNSKGVWKKSLKTKILKDRSLDVMESYSKWLNYYMDIPDPKHQYKTICLDYKDALDTLKKENIKAIYADPPYTRYHYSRYYHVLETMCLHDNPEVSTTFPNGKGGISRAIYRVDRHQSPFCIKSKAEGAFDILFQKVGDLGVPLILSYSPFDSSKKAVTPRLQTIDQLIEKANQYYSSVTTMSPGEFTHSKLNSVDNNFDSNNEAEILIVCQNERQV